MRYPTAGVCGTFRLYNDVIDASINARRHDVQHNDVKHNDVQHNGVQHNDPQYNNVQHDDPQY
jgi:hypothetical protein